MIKTMRFKFITITMVSLFILLSSILISTNIVMERSNNERLNKVLVDLVEKDGIVIHQPSIPELQVPPPRVGQGFLTSFSVKVDYEGNVIEYLGNGSNWEIEDVKELTKQVLAESKTHGTIDQMQYLTAEKEYGTIVAFVDQSIQDVMLTDLRRTSYVMGGTSIIVLFAIVFFLSKLVTKPIEVAFEKQKRFISDSGHELKTPLSILSANADMMELEIGKNKWLTQIKEQSKRMNNLIHELLTLAKTEDMSVDVPFVSFNLTQTITNTVLPFEVLAYEQGKEIACEVPDGIFYNGSEKSIKEMVDALMDNAIKYSDRGSTVRVRLSVKGAKKLIEVSNVAPKINEEEKDKLFEKFYRLDDSRSRETGGYGLGLAIVKNIVDMHKGKIEIENNAEGYISFKVTLV